ncbi:hypothetical protein B0H63DRAFT_161752 [Podospora didyma]|uniref:Uncharacterized protein n=1 Tax=Podospora didyma TaxID=330526 RepID=A0AAE0NTU0_9PEZI|nr:hypothetical protein B0H63DRAFT_161752 [Podospora didyma]
MPGWILSASCLFHSQPAAGLSLLRHRQTSCLELTCNRSIFSFPFSHTCAYTTRPLVPSTSGAGPLHQLQPRPCCTLLAPFVGIYIPRPTQSSFHVDRGLFSGPFFKTSCPDYLESWYRAREITSTNSFRFEAVPRQQENIVAATPET